MEHHELENCARSTRIRQLNDNFRKTGRNGQVMITRGLLAIRPPIVNDVVQAVRAFDQFDEDNDPYGEHDFGTLTVSGEKIFWKIDYYDKAMQWASPDPTDPAQTCRVMTIMLASEY